MEEAFLSLCVFQGEDLCTTSLVKLCSRLSANEDISLIFRLDESPFNELHLQ